MLAKLNDLFECLRQAEVRYCHWKSNAALGESLSGKTDVDILIARHDSTRIRVLLGQLGFKPAVATDIGPLPSVEHYYGLDEATGVLVHVHAYFRVITGDSLAKNYRLPIEDLLLTNTRDVGGVRVPAKSAELLVFTLRMMLKHTSLIELLLLARYWKKVPQEAAWLAEADSTEETVAIVNRWLPAIDPRLFRDCVESLRSAAPLLRRVLLARRLRSQIRQYTRHSAFRAWLHSVRSFSLLLRRRVIGPSKGMVPANGGVMIAFVGSEATGKSTLLAEIQHWLGEHFTVQHVHAGKPRATLLSLIPNLFVPVFRRLLPTCRTTGVERQITLAESSKEPRAPFPVMYGIRSALLAHDRRSWLTRLFARAANGDIVLCDRYPSIVAGAPDSPQLSWFAVPPGRFSIRAALTAVEGRLYRDIPPPDLVVHLTAPLAVTLSRNAARDKVEPEDYVSRRHARSCALDFGRVPVHRMTTDQPLDHTIRELKKAIWAAL